ncbi:MAG TPA: ATP synthase F1 subunit epsilon, partial [Nitrospira sp.]|nr:ATP synthase F1 subunit epsilon [Nitrospira sp.]
MATRNTLHVEVVTAERELYNGEANLVSAPGTEGRMGILPRHAALLTTLAPGALRIELNGAEEPLFVSGGFLEVSND